MKKQLLNALICFMPLFSSAQQKPQTTLNFPKRDTIIFSKDSVPVLVVSYMGSHSWIIKSYYENGNIYQIQYERRRERVKFCYDPDGNLIETQLMKGRRTNRILNKDTSVLYETKNTFVQIDVD